MRGQFVRTIEKLGGQDDSLVLLLGDVGVYSFRGFQQKYPDRFYNIGICEQSMIGVAAGMAKLGLRPVVSTITPFLLERCLEQIKIDLCYQGLGATLVSVGGGIDYCFDGPTHHCYIDHALMKNLFNVDVVFPGSNQEFDLLFRQAYARPKVTYFRIAAQQHGLNLSPQDLILGRALSIKEGSAMTLVAGGPLLGPAMEAVQDLPVEVIYVHTLEPLDAQLIRNSASKTGKVLCLEEHASSGGLFCSLAARLAGLAGIRIWSLGLPDEFVTCYGTRNQACQDLGLDAKGIAQAVARILSS